MTEAGTEVQGSPEWVAARIGRVGASRVADIVARTKTGYSTSRANYMAELVTERLTGVMTDSFTSAAMQWGTANEPDARIAYEFWHDAAVEKVGFILHPKIEMAGASPDGLVGSDGLVEIKCPLTATHIETLLTKKVPGRYETQMMWQMACTDRAWCDFVSFDPRMPENMRMFVTRVPRDEGRVRELEQEVSAFLFEVDATVRKLRSMYE